MSIVRCIFAEAISFPWTVFFIRFRIAAGLISFWIRILFFFFCSSVCNSNWHYSSLLIFVSVCLCYDFGVPPPSLVTLYITWKRKRAQFSENFDLKKKCLFETRFAKCPLRLVTKRKLQLFRSWIRRKRRKLILWSILLTVSVSLSPEMSDKLDNYVWRIERIWNFIDKLISNDALAM